MIKICENKKCGKEFKAKRETAKYCSDKCRVKASRVSVTNNEIKSLSVTESGINETNEGKMAEKVSVTKNEVVESIDKSQLLSRAGAPKVPAGFDDKYSPNYDLSEAGFIRRNKNWSDFSERFRVNIRADAKQIKKDIAIELAMLQRMRAGGWVNPLTNTKLAPKT